MKRTLCTSLLPNYFRSLVCLISVGFYMLPLVSARALQPLSAFLNAARKHSFDIREAATVVKQRNEEWKAAIGRLLPNLSASGTFTHNSYEDRFLQVGMDSSGQPITAQLLAQNQLAGIFNLTVPLLDVASIQRARAAKVTEAAAAARIESTTLEVQKNIAKTYFQYIAAAALVGASDRSLLAAQENQKVSEIKLQAGTVSQLDLERAKADAERAKQVKADAELTQILAGRTLETLTGITPEGKAAKLEDDLHQEAPLSEWESKSGQIPAVKASKEDIKAAKLNENASWWVLAPTLAASFSDQITNQSGFSLQNNSWSLGLSLVWRFDLTTIFNARALASATSIVQIRDERTRRDAEDQIFNTWNQVKTYIIRSQAARAQVSASHKALELAQVRYKAGIATQLEVSQAERDELSAEANQIQTDADLAYARTLLRLDTAEPVEYDK